MENYLLLIISGLIGGFWGAFFAMYIPHLWLAPRLKIKGIDTHEYHYRLVVVNKGRSAAINAVGRISIQNIHEGDVIGTRQEIGRIKAERNPNDYWTDNDKAYLSAEEWRTGIEMEPLHWATVPNPMNLTINPSFVERLHFIYSAGPYIKVASENPFISRACLRLDSNKEYYGIAIISSENTKPSKQFKFKIILGNDNRAKISTYK